MLLTVSKEPSLEDDYVDIRYRELTAPISRIMDICNQGNQTLLGEIDEKTYPIDISDVLCIEWWTTTPASAPRTKYIHPRRHWRNWSGIWTRKGSSVPQNPCL